MSRRNYWPVDSEDREFQDEECFWKVVKIGGIFITLALAAVFWGLVYWVCS